MPPGDDSSYLVDVVGEPLAKGVAATVMAQPSDPVGYLAQWLLRYVKNMDLESSYYKEKKLVQLQESRRKAQASEAAKKTDAAASARAAAVEALGAVVDEPRKVWQAAVDLVKKHIPHANAYVANIVEDEEPERSSDGVGAAADGDGDGGADSDREEGVAGGGGPSALLALLSGFGAQDAGGEQGREDGGGGEDVADVDDVAGGGASQDGEEGGAGARGLKLPDYSSKLLSYVTASPGQEFMTKVELRRRQPAAGAGVGEGDGGESARGGGGGNEEAVPVTFRVLDEHLPLLEVPAVSLEPRIRFLNPDAIPKLGGYVAAAAPAASAAAAPAPEVFSNNPLAGGRYHCILAADTLYPEGSAQPFSQEEVAFISELAIALGKALDAGEATRNREAAPVAAVAGEAIGANTEYAAVSAGAANAAVLRKAIEGVYAAAAAPAELPEVGEPPAEPEEGAPEPTLEEAIELATAAVSHLDASIKASNVAASNAEGVLSVEDAVLAAIKEAIARVRGVALRALRMLPSSPPATFHVLRAVLLLLGRDASSLRTWREASAQLGLKMFDELAGYDAHTDINAILLKSVRSACKSIRDRKALESELPTSCLGVLLLAWVKQVHRVSRSASALKLARQQLEAIEAARVMKEAALEAAKEAKAKADAVAAEEAAAVEAAAAEAAAAEASAIAEEEGVPDDGEAAVE